MASRLEALKDWMSSEHSKPKHKNSSICGGNGDALRAKSPVHSHHERKAARRGQQEPVERRRRSMIASFRVRFA